MSASEARYPGFDDLDVNALSQRSGVKWARAVRKNSLPAWVADMDFPLAGVIGDAVIDVIRRGDVGYPNWPNGTPLRAEFARRMRDRHGWQPDPGAVREHTDLIQALQLVLRLATDPGDGVAIQTPNYPPFLATLSTMGLRTVALPYVDTGDQWSPDFDAWARALRLHRPKVLILVNPHNPTGRVHSAAELERIAALAAEHDLLVLADEIHAELIYTPHRHIPFASVSADAANRTVTVTSASKAFNLAGFRCALAHFGPTALLSRRDAEPPDLYGVVSVPGVLATLAAWQHGDPWLADLIRVLDRNRQMVHDRVSAALPDVRHHLPQGTYLSWLDVSPLGIDDPVDLVLREGRVLLDGGRPFGPASGDFLRVNFATSHSILEQVLTGVVDALAGASRSRHATS